MSPFSTFVITYQYFPMPMGLKTNTGFESFPVKQAIVLCSNREKAIGKFIESKSEIICGKGMGYRILSALRSNKDVIDCSKFIGSKPNNPTPSITFYIENNTKGINKRKLNTDLDFHQWNS
jgi:hypothetical protein